MCALALARAQALLSFFHSRTAMLRTAVLALFIGLGSAAVHAAPLSLPDIESAHALVMDEESGEVLLEKDADTAAPIASMTKLMTAMVVLDAKLPPYDVIRIDRADLDTLKHTHSGVPVGAVLPRRTLIEIALMSSDNHAAAALARTYPGGMPAFLAATQKKITELKLENTGLVEPTGLSPENHATAHDMAKILRAASSYPEIVEATSQSSSRIAVNGRGRMFHNTNKFVGQPGWDISVSKTGFTNEAGRCLSMRLEAAGRKLLVVLMGAMAGSERAVDVLNIHRMVAGDVPAPMVQPVRAVRSVTSKRPQHRV
ncbi:peptidase S11 [Albitalea terrae]|uniref:Peptidase S11 n=1 Tax=Piscinibacter terrae TaxID=2496871 RepID=A0A3N7HLN3_9BURK|nr:peptidase S11 [Albitalea terrae]